jgi:tetratricopeptide (TPR) repeat protein
MKRRQPLKRRTATHSPKIESTPANKPGGNWRKPIVPLLTIAVILAVAGWATGTLATVPIFFARYELALRNDLKATRWLDIAESLNGDRSEVSLLKARIARRFNDLEEMEKQLRNAIAGGGDPKEIDRERTLASAQTGQIDRVIGDIEQWMTDPGNNVADLADAYSTALQQKGRTNEAKVVLNVWIADCPSDPRPHVQWAQIAETELNPELAHQHYKLAMDKNPDYPPLLHSYGRFLLTQKQPAEAIEVLQSCLEVAPAAAPAVKTALAASHRLLGNRDIAFELLEDVIATRQRELIESFLRLSAVPEPGEPEFELGKLYFDESNFQQAETYFRKASELSPDHFDAERQLGLTLQRLGRESEAAAVMERVDQKRKELADIAPYLRRINTKPEDYDARFQIAMILLRNGREQRAIEYFDGVLIDAPDHEPTHQRLFEIYSRKSLTETEFSKLAVHHRQVLERLNQRPTQ